MSAPVRQPVLLHVGGFADYYAQHPVEGVPSDPARLAAAIGAWRAHLAGKLAPHLQFELTWDERMGQAMGVPLDPRTLHGLKLLAVYADRTDLDLPAVLPLVLEQDPVFAAAQGSDFARSRFSQILVPDLWLPAEFDLTVKFTWPDGLEATFGSVVALRDQLTELNRVCFQLDAQALRDAITATPEGVDPVSFAQAGLAAFLFGAELAGQRRLPLLLGSGPV